MTAAELAAYLTDYAASFAAPIEHDSEVQRRHARRARVRRPHRRGDVDAPQRRARHRLVRPAPRAGDRRRAAPVDPPVHTPSTYRSPADLPAGGVLVVGASATGVQLADELARAGRDVVLAVGRHSRVPRRYRGMDIWWWLDRIGTFATTIDSVSDPARSRAEGAVQLVGRDDHRDVDLAALQRLGVRLTGRLTAIDGVRATFADDLATTTAAADERLARLLGQIDAHIARARADAARCSPPTSPAPVPAVAPLPVLDLRADGIATVLWATGYRRHHPWLHVPVLDRTGEIAQRRGVTPVDGLYVLGQRFQHRRDSNFIDGVRHDAVALAHHLADRFPAAGRPLTTERTTTTMTTPRSSTTHDVIVVGARAAGAATAHAARPGRPRRARRRPQPRRRRHAVDPRPDARRRRPAAPLGLLDAVIAAGTPPVRRTTFTYADDVVADHDQAVARRRRPLRAPPHGPRPDPRRRGRRRRRRGPLRHHRHAASPATTPGGSTASRPSTDGARALHRARWVVGADGIRSAVAAPSARPSSASAPAARPSSTATGPGSTSTATSGSSAPTPAPGRSRPTSGRTCVFAAATPERVGRGGLGVLRDVVAAASPELAARLAAAGAPEGVRSFGGRPGYLRRPWGPGWALVGDAGYWKDPISAHGLTDALRDAELLATAIVATASGDADARRPRSPTTTGPATGCRCPLFDVVDTIAGMRWTDAEIPGLLLQLSSAMSDEVEALAGRDAAPVGAGRP